MKKSIIVLTLISFCFICFTFCTQQKATEEQETSAKEIKQKDSTIQSTITKMLSDEVFTISKTEYVYFFKRLEDFAQKGGQVKFGEQYFNVARENNEYVFETTIPDTSDEDHFYFKLTKKFAEDIINGKVETLEVVKIKDLHENE